MDDVVAPSVAARAWALLALAAASLAAYLLTPAGRPEALVSEALVVLACGLSALATLRWSRGWPSRRGLAALLATVGAGNLLFLLLDLVRPGAYQPRPSDVLFLLVLVPLAFTAQSEFRAHFESKDRREVAIDVGLITASLASIAYVLIRPSDASPVVSGSTGVFVIVAAAVFTVFATLALWVPTTSHVLLFVACAVASAAGLEFGWLWANGAFDGSAAAVDVPLMLAPVAVAAVVSLLPHERHRPAPSRVARPVLTSIAVIAACGALAVVATMDHPSALSGTQSTLIILLLGAGVAVRILSNQLSSAQAHDHVREALVHREQALADADRALERVREQSTTLRRSEEHLRLVFDAAVDGFVELDERNTIVRANDAFGRMIGIDRATIEGRPWGAVAAAVNGADPSFATMPDTGQGIIHRTEGQPLYLESRVSSVPTEPPLRLLLVRDVTATKVADQTIRSLFQFLQDRDEDRTRLFRRTNAAIEQERNRIARDLHDGPVQGVSAASLSLEAALLMIKAGDLEHGLDVLAKIREELALEADSLRRLMSGLRPPVLEERGLLPALRDNLMRFGTEHGLLVEFDGTLSRDVPDDLETLAYRVVQEALANVAKHADATRVSVAVDTEGSQLRIEVEDDGRGFDPNLARDFLHAGRVGLASMRERVELASGTFAVRSTPGRGTAVMATIPLDAALVVVAAD
ncbi:MAG: ATP-binding protein [Actinomycetota bacterium]